MTTDNRVSVKLSRETYDLVSEIGKYKESIDEIIYRIAKTYYGAFNAAVNISNNEEKEDRLS